MSQMENTDKPAFDPDLFDPYERLVEIEVLGRSVRVPERNRLLRCFQYLSIQTISYGDFCWNGDCTNCQFWYHEEEQTEAQDKTALACRFDVREGLVVTRLSPHVRIKGVTE
ncbi:MAG: hypothetical protein QOH49_2597 [Acidobacteriota bacterium]|nr:hypothetical protein [Acidobacteriota bacterium]